MKAISKQNISEVFIIDLKARYWMMCLSSNVNI